MQRHEVTYLAGLFEGEGWFGVNRRTVRGKEYLNPGLSIKMVDEDIIYYVKHLIGHGSIHSTILPSGKTAYIYSTSGKNAIEFMRLVKPWMGTRREGQINMALQMWENKHDLAVPPVQEGAPKVA